MALIRAVCSDCGEVELRSRDIKVRTCVDTQESTYVFVCPVCRMVEVRPAEPHVVDVLLIAGCREETWRLPDELKEVCHGATINQDDVLDFHLLLKTDGWFDALVQARDA